MQRYTPYVDYENLHDDEEDVTVLPKDDGAWVLHSESRAEITSLQSSLTAMTENAERLAKYLLDARHYDFDWNGAIDALAAHRKLMEGK